MRNDPPLFPAGGRVSVLGLGASGVAAARLAAAHGAEVYASDVYAGESQKEAAATLQGEGIDAEAGGHDLERILESDVCVISPGIDPSTEVRQAVREAGLPCVAEVELAYRYLRSRIIGITGTNGKTTTTALCGHLLIEAGLDAATAGNIGRPLSDIALEDRQPEWVVVELSSFQLADLARFTPEMGVLLNLAPDHLDRYASLDRYYEDKERLFVNASEESRWLLNADDDVVMRMAKGVPGTHYHASLSERPRPGAFVDEEGRLALALEDRQERWVPVEELRMAGSHNVMNALLAGMAAALAGCAAKDIARGLRSFESLPHRLQPVGEFDGVLWVNDSKATNVSAARVALRAFRRPVVAILGGRHKGEPYSSLGPDLERARGIVAFGEAAPQIVAELRDAVPVLKVASGVEAVVRMAAELARKGDVVLFSPACSSYDMFPNYEARGRAFEDAVRELHAGARDTGGGGGDGRGNAA